MLKIKHIKTRANLRQQVSKVVEEHNEFLDSGYSANESCDCIRAHMTYLENHCGGFDKHWKEHLKKMRKRKYKTREAYDDESVEDASTIGRCG